MTTASTMFYCFWKRHGRGGNADLQTAGVNWCTMKRVLRHNGTDRIWAIFSNRAVFVYTLQITYVDGSQREYKGSISLIR